MASSSCKTISPEVAADIAAVLAEPWAEYHPAPGTLVGWGIAAMAGAQILSGIIGGHAAKAASQQASDSAAQQSREAFERQTAYINQQEAAQRAAIEKMQQAGNPYFQASGMLRPPDPNQYAMPGGGGQVFSGGSATPSAPVNPLYPQQAPPAPGQGRGAQPFARNMNVPMAPPQQQAPAPQAAPPGPQGMSYQGVDPSQAAPGTVVPGSAYDGQNQGTGVYTTSGMPGPNPSYQPAAHGYYFNGDSANGAAVWAPTLSAAESLWSQQNPNAHAQGAPPPQAPQQPAPFAPMQGGFLAPPQQRFPGLLATGGSYQQPHLRRIPPRMMGNEGL